VVFGAYDSYPYKFISTLILVVPVRTDASLTHPDPMVTSKPVGTIAPIFALKINKYLLNKLRLRRKTCLDKLNECDQGELKLNVRLLAVKTCGVPGAISPRRRSEAQRRGEPPSPEIRLGEVTSSGRGTPATRTRLITGNEWARTRTARDF